MKNDSQSADQIFDQGNLKRLNKISSRDSNRKGHVLECVSRNVGSAVVPATQGTAFNSFEMMASLFVSVDLNATRTSK